MTPNEKKALVKFKEIKQGNTVAIAGTLRVTINYAGDICKKLHQKGYLERLLPGMFAVYKITPLGEGQVKEEGESDRDLGVDVGAEEENRKEAEEMDEYECVSCGVAVKEKDTECPNCGIIFEGYEEEPEEEMAERESSLCPASPSPEERSEEAPQPTPQTPEGSEGSVGEKVIDEIQDI